MSALRLNAGLAAFAAVLALLTWLRDPPSALDAGRVLIWEEDSAQVTAVVWEGGDRRVEVQRRTDSDGEPYYWAVEVGADGETEYPVGTVGRTLADELARFRVVRDLGVVGDLGVNGGGVRAGAAESARVELVLGDRSRVLLVGDTTYGGEGRYVRTEGEGRTVVVPTSLFRPLEIGTEALRERQVHRFVPGDVSTARVLVAGRTIEAEKVDGTWRGAGTEGPDAVLSGLLERAGQLAIAGFDLSRTIASEPILRIEYAAEDGDELGFVEFMADGEEYFLRSETTRVPALAIPSLAERVVQAVEELIQG